MLFFLAKIMSIKLNWKPESVKIVSFVVKLEIMKENSKIGSLMLGWLDILCLKVSLESRLVMWELLVDDLFIFFNGRFSKKCLTELQGKRRFSFLLLSFSSFAGGPWNLGLVGFMLRVNFFFLLLLKELFALVWDVKEYIWVDKHKSILEVIKSHRRINWIVICS